MGITYKTAQRWRNIAEENRKTTLETIQTEEEQLSVLRDKLTPKEIAARETKIQKLKDKVSEFESKIENYKEIMRTTPAEKETEYYNEGAKDRTMRYMAVHRKQITLNFATTDLLRYRAYAKARGTSFTKMICDFFEKEMQEHPLPLDLPDENE